MGMLHGPALSLDGWSKGDADCWRPSMQLESLVRRWCGKLEIEWAGRGYSLLVECDVGVCCVGRPP